MITETISIDSTADSQLLSLITEPLKHMDDLNITSLVVLLPDIRKSAARVYDGGRVATITQEVSTSLHGLVNWVMQNVGRGPVSDFVGVQVSLNKGTPTTIEVMVLSHISTYSITVPATPETVENDTTVSDTVDTTPQVDDESDTQSTTTDSVAKGVDDRPGYLVPNVNIVDSSEVNGKQSS